MQAADLDPQPCSLRTSLELHPDRPVVGPAPPRLASALGLLFKGSILSRSEQT